ncbi:histidine kinase [Dysgonomonas sp. GY75]|uniref:sensor histidine kinase n=1 Tax=Dysgonomonas sp. GY75 TaxID=2780419 RepID=UPI0018845F7F|nr:histidine kinase [Dysgonomonas sp. GY75]MBF0651456.1 histidine kinase [Dysgonomonas sp. GY75]
MNKILSYIRSSAKAQSILIWSVIYTVGFIQNLWISVEWSLKVGTLNFICMVAIYYTTHNILIPRLLIKERKILYFIFSIILIVLFANICARFELYMLKELAIETDQEFKFVFSISRFTTIFILIYAIANIIFFSRKSAEDARLKEKLLSEKKMLEARVLKSQINSHFIFNALNNIYSMTYFKDEYTSGYVLKLAQMMRYVMEDCETELTPLSKDIEYIHNFIDFQKLRFENDKDITFVYKNEEDTNICVPPMIFQPLVENCFKHTPLEVDKNSFIHILLKVEKKQIYFVAENSQPLIKNKPLANGGGIGIENVKRRLDLYFENRYSLEIFNNPDSFKIELSIDFESSQNASYDGNA